MSSTPANIAPYLAKIKLPASDSHKGQNGKLLIIGGSKLFHAASKWSLDIASKFVDMVFYSSVPENNALIAQAKQNFWNGIVINRDVVEDYVEEADCILIGPGMTRTEDTAQITNHLLKKYPDKKWVVDAGALQMVDPNLLNSNCIITPHKKEFEEFTKKLSKITLQKWYKKIEGEHEVFISPTEKASHHYAYQRKTLYSESFLSEEGSKQKILLRNWSDPVETALHFKDSSDPHEKSTYHDICLDLYKISLAANNATILLKGKTDLILCPENECILFSGDEKFMDCVHFIEGGNPGMTKGGTGDVLAGLLAALYCTHDAKTAAIVASYINKAAGDALYERVGPYFNASDLVGAIPGVMWKFFNE
jgi:NAD(P)H-hydrate repair Nnr-like enzyme with NAD(P)H-hydrate dehydratase domain